MQDRAAPHFSCFVTDVLNERFPDAWIGRDGTIPWPPRSPDLSSLWGYIENTVYAEKMRIFRKKQRVIGKDKGIAIEIDNNTEKQAIVRMKMDTQKSCRYSIYTIHPITPPSAVCNPNNLNKNSVHSSNQTTYISDAIQNYSEGNKEPDIININTINLKIFNQNIRWLRNKIEELIMHLSNCVPHVLCFTEHHLKIFEINNTRINHYNLGTSYCRKTHKLGGVGIFVHDIL
jgi:hypothetical protein